MTTFAVRVEDAAIQLALKRARSEIGQQTKQGILKGAEHVLPGVKAAAPSPVSQYLLAKATTRSAYITTRGPKVYDRIAGLLEFGGRIGGSLKPEDWIYPKKKQALRIGGTGELRAVVAGERKYTGRHRIYNALSAALPVAATIAEGEVMASLREMGL